LTQEQKTHLKYLLRIHTHPKITPEIRRELFQSKCRGDPEDTPETTTTVESMDVSEQDQ